MIKQSDKLNFVKRDTLTENIDLMLGDYINKVKQEVKTVFSPSQITECPRRICYRSNGTIPEKFSINNLSDNLDCIKHKWIERFKHLPKIKLLDSKVLVSDCNFNIVGTLDAILNISGELVALNIQAVNNDDFKKIIQKGATRKHVIETMVYMWMAETANGLIVYENVNNNDYVIFHILEYKPIINAIQKKCNLMSDYKVKGKLPNRPYENESEECKVCEFQKKCWGIK